MQIKITTGEFNHIAQALVGSTLSLVKAVPHKKGDYTTKEIEKLQTILQTSLQDLVLKYKPHNSEGFNVVYNKADDVAIINVTPKIAEIAAEAINEMAAYYAPIISVAAGFMFSDRLEIALEKCNDKFDELFFNSEDLAKRRANKAEQAERREQWKKDDELYKARQIISDHDKAQALKKADKM